MDSKRHDGGLRGGGDDAAKDSDAVSVHPTTHPCAADHMASPSRREFLKTTAAGALLLGSGLAQALPGGLDAKSKEAAGRRRGQNREIRELIFDLSTMDTRRHRLVLVAGTRRYRLRRTRRAVFRRLRRRHPVLGFLPFAKATHWVQAGLPADAIQYCYVQRIPRDSLPRRNSRSHCCTSPGRSWDLVLQFMHVPAAAQRAAWDRIQGQLGADELPPVPGKWQQYGVTGDDLAAFDDPVGADVLKDSNDTASTMLSLHPEMISGDPTTYAYIQQQIIGPQQQTADLGQLIGVLGPIEPQQSWTSCDSPFEPNKNGYGTNVPVCNPDTGMQALNSQGQLQYVPVYADSTNEVAQAAITPALQSLKADPTLGVNDTQSPDQADGVMYRYAEGVPTSDQTVDGLGAGSGLSYTTKDYAPGQGYSAEVLSVEAGSSGSGVEAIVTVLVKNWYVRTLGLFVRYLDGDGNVLSVDEVTDDIGSEIEAAFPLQQEVGGFWNTADDFFLDVLPPEKEFLAIPTGTPQKTLAIPVPSTAVAFDLLASGMGNTPANANPYNGTTPPGATMTGLFNLSLPSLFLALNAAAGAGKMSNALSSDTQTILNIFPLVMTLFADSFEAIGFADPAAMEGIAKAVGQKLLTSGATNLVKFVVTYLAEGETQDDLLDAIPVIGGFLAMVQAMGTAATIAETSTQVLQSPSTYRFSVTLTHDIDVVIAGDSVNGGIWPSEATSYKVILLFDGGTPTTLTQQVPSTAVKTQTASFLAVPLGGQVTASVQVYSDTGYQVAQASAGPFPNDEPNPGEPKVLNLTLTQNLVPLTASTVYSHKEVIALDADGSHVWKVTTTPPTQEPSGCTPASGQLCQLTGITVNTTAGAVAQSFESANDAVVSCSSGAGGQLHQFTNVSVGASPQTGFFSSGCGFTTPPRLAYDVVNNPDFNFYLDTQTTGAGFLGGVIRQVRLGSTNPGYDGPESNLAWGKLQFPSDAFLLHPGGKIVSVNSTHSKIEVVNLQKAAVPDDQAPISQTYGGRGLRQGLMDGPALAALAPDGTVLVLESYNARIQAFDLNANPSQRFGIAKADYFFPLKEQPVTQYLEFAVEFEGYMYVLSVDALSGTPVYTLDIYDPLGNWLTSTPGFEATRMTVSYFRDLYTQNFQVLLFPNDDLPDRTEPSISHWIPSTPTS